MNRKLFWGVLAIGLALVIAPFVISLPSKAAAGQRMMSGFQPIMQPAQVQKTADYYNNTFTNLRPVALAMNPQTVAKFAAYGKGIAGVQAESTKLVPALSQATGRTPAQVQQFLGTQFPAMSQLFAGLPQMSKDFGGLIGLMQQNVQTFKRVPPGLDHYKPLVTTMQANVDNYRQVNSLPDFRLFTVFFLVPGILLVLLAGYGLFGESLAAKAHFHHGARPTPA